MFNGSDGAGYRVTGVGGAHVQLASGSTSILQLLDHNSVIDLLGYFKEAS